MAYAMIHDGRNSYGEQLDSPEFRSTCPKSCVRCHAEMDSEDDTFHLVYSENVCGDCMEACSLCGEWLDDATFPWSLDVKDRRKFVGGPIAIRFREWQTNGKLSASHCPMCAANWLLEKFSGVDFFDADEHCKEEIRLMLAANGALPGMVEAEYIPVAQELRYAAF